MIAGLRVDFDAETAHRALDAVAGLLVDFDAAVYIAAPDPAEPVEGDPALNLLWEEFTNLSGETLETL